MTARKRDDRDIMGTMARALELTEDALGEVARIAIEEIHSGLESSNHVQAAERDMRSALRQLVLAERELRSKARARPGVEEPGRPSVDERARPTVNERARPRVEGRSGSIAEVVRGPGSDAAPRDA